MLRNLSAGNMAGKTKKGAAAGALSQLSVAKTQEFAPEATVVTPRRFCAQQASVDSEQIGFSLP